MYEINLVCEDRTTHEFIQNDIEWSHDINYGKKKCEELNTKCDANLVWVVGYVVFVD